MAGPYTTVNVNSKGAPMRLAPTRPSRGPSQLGAANPNLPHLPARATHVQAPRAPKPVKPPKITKPAAPAAPAAPANPYAQANTALTNPNATLSGTALQQAAQALADAQTKGPLAELAAQIALNQRQTAAAQKNTAGYFNQLGQYVTQGNQQLGTIAGDLNTQLQGIGSNTQNVIGTAYQPGQGLSNLAASGLASGAMGSLDADRSMQQGIAAQDAQAFRSQGALQGANYRSLGASNLGTYALRGQETLGKIGQAGQLANEPLNQKTASLLASKGALYSTSLGKLRQQEINNSITKAGLGLKADSLSITAQNNQANQRLKSQALSITQQNNRANQRIAQINARISQGNLSERQRHDLVTERTGLINATRARNRGSGGSAGGGGGGLTASQRIRSKAQGTNAVDSAYSTINQLKGMGLSNSQIRSVLTTGYLRANQGGKPVTLRFKTPPGLGQGPIANAAFDLWVYHYLSPADVRALKGIGFDPTGIYPTTPTQQGVGGAAGTIAGGTRSLNPF